jgi:phosphatidylglycerophosphate synthase
MTRSGCVRLKEKDACWTVCVIDPIAGWLVGLARDRPWVVPARLTAGCAAVAVLAAVAFALGHEVLGALLFQASFLLDCMDGKLAATRDSHGPLGEMADVAADSARLGLCATGLAVALTRDGRLPVAGVSYAAALVCLYVGARVAVAAIAAARPPLAMSQDARRLGMIDVRATPWAILRAARRRSRLPGTTVDTEAIAFTIGPLLSLPVQAIAAAIALDVAYALAFGARAVYRARRDKRAHDVTVVR